MRMLLAKANRFSSKTSWAHNTVLRGNFLNSMGVQLELAEIVGSNCNCDAKAQYRTKVVHPANLSRSAQEETR